MAKHKVSYPNNNYNHSSKHFNLYFLRLMDGRFISVVLILTFMGPCIIKIFQYISNKIQHYTVYFYPELLYMFRVVPPPIIRSANSRIFSIWYLSHRYCYLLLL